MMCRRESRARHFLIHVGRCYGLRDILNKPATLLEGYVFCPYLHSAAIARHGVRERF